MRYGDTRCNRRSAHYGPKDGDPGLTSERGRWFRKGDLVDVRFTGNPEGPERERGRD